ncbi:MAG: hypothetical protein K2O12_05700, partial [Muribaculaceae bacterium]|nr:hypothetical protein [Muribaculaceae bacterium]
MAVAATLPAQQLAAECSYPNKGTSFSRALSSFEITDGINSATVSVGQSTGGGSSIYFDKTGLTPLETFPGSVLSFSNIAWSGSWMHSYLFIDYDGDGEYDTTLNASGTTGGELVSYTYYNGSNSLGESAAEDGGVSADVMPSFTLPQNLTPGNYKALFKVDWNDNTPCGSNQIGSSEGAAVEFIIKLKTQGARTISISSNDPDKGTVAFDGHAGNTVTISGPVTITATPAKGYSFINWTTGSSNTVFSTQNPLTVNNDSDISLVGNFSELTYPVMTRTYTNNATQDNRYLKKVTTQGTATEVVFDCATSAELPYTPFSASANTYVAEGANIDKTANPIVVESGTTSFTMTYYGWEDSLNGHSAQMNWVQEAYYVDWNGDGLFSGANEISAKGWTTMPNANIYTGASRTVTIPAGQAPGTYRMRVVFYEPASSATMWQNTLFTTLRNQIRNGVSYDMTIQIKDPSDMEVTEATVTTRSGKTNPDTKNVPLATIKIATSGSLNPLPVTS